jgi:hypothetical protein
MVEFVPFGVSKTAQDIINEHLNTPKTPSTDVFRNPNFDLRTEQGLPSDALYPNPLLDTTPPTDAPVDPCPPGYMLVDGICQPIEQFGQSSYQEDNDRDDPEERPYMSIEDMKNASDEDLLNYLKDGRLSNSALGFLPSKGNLVTLKKSQFMPPLFKLAFGGQDKMREEFMLSELMKRGYFTGNFDKNQNPIFDIGNKNVNTNTGGIESLLPANNMNEPVTDVFGDTYQQVYNSGTGDTGYTFTSGTPLPAVSQQTQTGVNYGTGRGGTSSNQMTGGGTVMIGGNAFNPNTNPEDDYNDESSGI